MVRLTTTVKTSGCAAKLAAGELDKILSSMMMPLPGILVTEGL